MDCSLAVPEALKASEILLRYWLAALGASCGESSRICSISCSGFSEKADGFLPAYISFSIQRFARDAFLCKVSYLASLPLLSGGGRVQTDVVTYSTSFNLGNFSKILKRKNFSGDKFIFGFCELKLDPNLMRQYDTVNKNIFLNVFCIAKWS